MTELVYNTERVEETQALWTYQFLDKPTIQAITEALAEQSQDIENALDQLRKRLDIDSQTGVQLNKIGILVGQPREGRTDPIYRLWLKARIRVNRSSGSPSDMYAVARLILEGATLRLEQIPVGHVMHALGASKVSDVVSVQRLLQDASPVAVPFYYSYTLGNPVRFELATGSVPFMESALGLDNGRLVEWIGPEQGKQNHYALLAHFLNWRLTAAWDCRDVAIDNDGNVVALRGYRGKELAPDGVVTRDDTVLKSYIRGVQGTLELTGSAVPEIFNVNDWTIALTFDYAGGSVVLFEATDTESLQLIRIMYDDMLSGFKFTIRDTVAVSYLPAGPVSNGLHTVIFARKDNNLFFWIDGIGYTSTTSLVTDSINHISWINDKAGYSLVLAANAVTDEQAAQILETHKLQFTDEGYFTALAASFFSGGVHAVYDVLDFESLTFSGNDVVLVENQAKPGTRDLDLSVAPPEYVADGLDGQPCLRFRNNKYGVSLGWTIATGDRPSVHAVMQVAVIERKSWFSLAEGSTLRHWGYLETGSTAWRQLTVAGGDYGAAVVDTPGLHQSGFPVGGHYTRLNLGSKASNGGTTGIGGAATACFVGSRFNDGNSLNYLDCDISLFVVTVESDDTEAENFARDYVAPKFPTIAGALP